MERFVIRVKSKDGQKLVEGLLPDDTLTKLKNKLFEITGIKPAAQSILQGFPPKPLDLSNGNATLRESNIKSMDTLILEEKQVVFNGEQENVENAPRSHITEAEDCSGVLLKTTVPSDNSCLFTSIGFVLSGRIDPGCAPLMREIIASVVSANPEEYCEAMLGKPNKEYCEWIQKPDSWGGAIELAILSEHYGLEIAVVDSTNAIINRFGEDKHYAQRVLLLFDGIHYDPLHLESGTDGSIQSIFPCSDEGILRKAAKLGEEAKSSHQYTDIQKFTLKCMICDVKLTGSEAAQKHAKETGHQSFGEMVA